MRPFWHNGWGDPNDYYRKWLEDNVGKQGSEWQWDIWHNNADIVRIEFSKEEDAILFELRWD